MIISPSHAVLMVMRKVMLAPCAAHSALTLAMIPTVSRPVTVMTAFIKSLRSDKSFLLCHLFCLRCARQRGAGATYRSEETMINKNYLNKRRGPREGAVRCIDILIISYYSSNIKIKHK